MSTPLTVQSASACPRRYAAACLPPPCFQQGRACADGLSHVQHPNSPGGVAALASACRCRYAAACLPPTATNKIALVLMASLICNVHPSAKLLHLPGLWGQVRFSPQRRRAVWTNLMCKGLSYVIASSPMLLLLQALRPLTPAAAALLQPSAPACSHLAAPHCLRCCRHQQRHLARTPPRYCPWPRYGRSQRCSTPCPAGRSRCGCWGPVQGTGMHLGKAKE